MASSYSYISKLMKIKASATLIAPVRNVATNIELTVEKLNGILTTVFESYAMVLVESDSSDATVELGLRLQSEGKVTAFKSLGELSPRFPIRCDRIATARNEGLAIARNIKNNQFFLFADFDGPNNSLTAQGILSCFNYSGWSAMVANQYGRYYDIWALRHKIWCPGDCWQEYKELQHEFGPALARWIAVGSRQIHIPPTTKPIKVDSAFGGFGIYRAESIRGAAWCGLNTDGVEVVDWLAFNRSVIGPIAINPMLRNTGPPEHYVNYPSAYKGDQ